MPPQSATREREVEDVAPDVVEVDVDSGPRVLAEPGGDRRKACVVVDCRIEAELAGQPFALVGTAGDADRAAAFDPRDLADDAPYRPSRARHDDGLARLGAADVEQAEVRGHARHSEHAEVAREGRALQIGAEHRAGVEHRIFLHTGHTGHVVTDGEAIIARSDDAAGTAGSHHLAQSHRRHV